MKKVLLWCAPRSASTNYLINLANDNPEMINHGESLRTLDYGHEDIIHSKAQRKQQFKHVMRSWENPTSSDCIKMFPLMITERQNPWRTDEFLQKLLSNATDNIFLMRKDYIAQVKSLAVAYHLLSMPTFKITNFHKNWDEPLFMPGGKKTDDIIRVADRQLYSQIFQLLTVYKNIPSSIMLNKQLIWTEDLDQSGKYKRPVIWEKEPEILYLDVQEQFD